MNIVIIDYDMGNPGSIMNMLKYLNIEAIISNNPEEIKKAKKIILPGVGAFDNGISNLKEKGLFNLLNEKVLVENTPILGICLGMQLMTLSSEEGEMDGFGWIKASVKRFSPNKEIKLKVPHIGWNNVEVLNPHPITDNITVDSKFYFVHSYHVVCEEQTDVISRTHYDISFDSIIAKDNIYGCQFHPEKSHKHGMKILENFQNI